MGNSSLKNVRHVLPVFRVFCVGVAVVWLCFVRSFDRSFISRMSKRNNSSASEASGGSVSTPGKRRRVGTRLTMVLKEKATAEREEIDGLHRQAEKDATKGEATRVKHLKVYTC